VTRKNLLTEARAASEDYARAKRQLAEHRRLHELGLRNELMTVLAIEHSAFNRWCRAITALNT
jgi:hypothetical protein